MCSLAEVSACDLSYVSLTPGRSTARSRRWVKLFTTSHTCAALTKQYNLVAAMS